MVIIVKKVKKKGQWNAKVLYRFLEKNATLDSLPDSDAYSGDTGVKGLELIVDLGIDESSKLGLDIYLMEDIQTTEKQTLIQLDYKIKF